MTLDGRKPQLTYSTYSEVTPILKDELLKLVSCRSDYSTQIFL